MVRFHSARDARIRARRRKAARLLGGRGNDNFNNRHPLACGKARCTVCHFNKVYGVLKVRDRIAELRLKDA